VLVLGNDFLELLGRYLGTIILDQILWSCQKVLTGAILTSHV